MFPTYALVVLVAVLGISAVVWTLGVRLRARRGEAPLPPMRTMMGRGLVAPTALIFMAADFATAPASFATWVGIVFGSWMVTLVVVRTVNRIIGFDVKAAPAANAPVAEVVQDYVSEPRREALASSAS